MSWQTEMTLMLRYLINDVSDTPTYTDARLQQTLVVGGQLVVDELEFSNNYTVDIVGTGISPDPTSGDRDNAFINLTLLKTACLMDYGVFRTKSQQAGISIKTGTHSIDTKGQLAGYQYLLENGPCKSYEDAKFEYQAGNMVPGKAILGPFAGINIETDWVRYTNNHGRFN